MDGNPVQSVFGLRVLFPQDKPGADAGNQSRGTGIKNQIDLTGLGGSDSSGPLSPVCSHQHRHGGQRCV